MKKYFITLIVFIFVFSINFSVTHAQNNAAATNPTPEQQRAALQAKIETFHTQAQIKLQALKASIASEKDPAQLKIKNDRLNNREIFLGKFGNVIEKLSGLRSKVSDILTSLGNKSVNVTNAESSLATSDIDMTSAKEKIAEMNDLLITSIAQLSPADKIKLKTLADDTQTLLNNVHAELKTSVTSAQQQLTIKLSTNQ